MNNIARYARLTFGLLENIVYLFANLIPKRKKLFLFSSWNGKKFLDNPKYIFKYCIEHEKDIQCLWVSRDRHLAKRMRQDGYPVVNLFSARGIWLQLRAEVVIFSHSVEWEFYAPVISYKTKRIQTWHGMPIKRIGYDDKYGVSLKRKKIIDFVYPYRADRLSMVLAASQSDKKCYISGFCVSEDIVKITGYPRNDAMFDGKDIDTTGGPTRIIYMPTLRGAVGSAFGLLNRSILDIDVLDAFLKKYNASLWIRLHPAQRINDEDLERINKSKCIYYSSSENDVYEELAKFDVLITDFSGVYFDFLITGRPIIMAPLLMGDYLSNDRELYYEYEELCLGDPARDWSEIMERLREVLSCESSVSDEYVKMQKRFHFYIDGNSSERAAKEIRQIAES
jgi:CDP-glycerol glycerophosphotransferase (TagB/SpsB family)